MFTISSRTNPTVLAIALLATLTGCAHLSPAPPTNTAQWTDLWPGPYTGTPCFSDEVDASTLCTKVMCGYQGWFCAEGDGMDRGWYHYWGLDGTFKPGHCSIEFWPDLSEFDDDETYPTPFTHADGAPASLFSSAHPKTVRRHFKWMREYGIDGVFIQRFAVETYGRKSLRHFNTVLDNCRDAANAEGRVYALMYDLSGLGEHQIEHVMQDWRNLVDKMRLSRDPADKAYLHHNGKPIVAVWGIGFNDDRKYSLKDCARFVRFLQEDPVYGGNTVMIGVPTFWRFGRGDALSHWRIKRIARKADIISPWMVGRFKDEEGLRDFSIRVWRDDMRWCAEFDKEYLPVVWPGFSWHNMFPETEQPMVARRGGQFLWDQFVAAIRMGAGMIYVAMFDEIDEGTAIFKCTNTPPGGDSPFLTYGGLPSDHYLWLTGQARQMLNNQRPVTLDLPPRP